MLLHVIDNIMLFKVIAVTWKFLSENGLSSFSVNYLLLL